MLERWDGTDLSCLPLRSPSLHFLCVAVVLFLFKAFNFFLTKTSPSILRSVQPQLWKNSVSGAVYSRIKQVSGVCLVNSLWFAVCFPVWPLTKLSRKFISCFRNLHKKLSRFKVCDGRAMKKTDTFKKKNAQYGLWSLVISVLDQDHPYYCN